MASKRERSTAGPASPIATLRASRTPVLLARLTRIRKQPGLEGGATGETVDPAQHRQPGVLDDLLGDRRAGARRCGRAAASRPGGGRRARRMPARRPRAAARPARFSIRCRGVRRTDGDSMRRHGKLRRMHITITEQRRRSSRPAAGPRGRRFPRRRRRPGPSPSRSWSGRPGRRSRTRRRCRRRRAWT